MSKTLKNISLSFLAYWWQNTALPNVSFLVFPKFHTECRQTMTKIYSSINCSNYSEIKMSVHQASASPFHDLMIMPDENVSTGFFISIVLASSLNSLVVLRSF